MTASLSLASPFHDPQARLLSDIKKYREKLSTLYDRNVAVSVSAATSERIIRALLAADIRLVVQPERRGLRIGNNYLLAIRKSLSFQTQTIHLLDFDRALHWVDRFPGELEQVTRKIGENRGLTILVRSKRAFETHPNVQRATENTVNTIASEVAGKDVDIMSGSFGMDRETALLLLEKSRCNDYGFYAEVLIIALKAGIPITTIEVEGLEWETPDQFRKEIERVGYMEWLETFESLSEWNKRVQIIEDSKDILITK